MNFTTLVKERYSCRKISSRPIESEKLEAIKQAAIDAPTAIKSLVDSITTSTRENQIRNTTEIPSYIPCLLHRW